VEGSTPSKRGGATKASRREAWAESHCREGSRVWRRAHLDRELPIEDIEEFRMRRNKCWIYMLFAPIPETDMKRIIQSEPRTMFSL
jgi:hypothetical protein